MSKIKIKNSKLVNSPVTANTNDSLAKDKRITTQRLITLLLIPLLLIILGLVIEYTFFSSEDMSKSKVNVENSSLENSPIVVDSPNSSITITTEDKSIRTLVVEARLYGIRKSGIETPPSSVEFTPIGGGSDATLDDNQLEFKSPVLFNVYDNEIEVVNRFVIQESSNLKTKT